MLMRARRLSSASTTYHGALAIDEAHHLARALGFRADDHAVAFDHVGLRQVGDHPVGQPCQIFALEEARHDNLELVAAKQALQRLQGSLGGGSIHPQGVGSLHQCRDDLIGHHDLVQAAASGLQRLQILIVPG